MIDIYGLGTDFATENTLDGVDPGTNAFMGDDFKLLTVMQFTGLKDIHNEYIFEGDIVRWGLNFSKNGYDDENWHRYAVVSFNPDIQFKIVYYIDSKTGNRKPTDDHVFKFGNFMYNETDKFLEIIGNIHDIADIL